MSPSSFRTRKLAPRLPARGVEAKPIHRLLEVNPKGGGFKRGQDNPLDSDLLVLDEASMVDVLLMNALLKAVPERSALLVIGDVDQLPAVGPGPVLADMIAGGAMPVVRLTEVSAIHGSPNSPVIAVCVKSLGRSGHRSIPIRQGARVPKNPDTFARLIRVRITTAPLDGSPLMAGKFTARDSKLCLGRTRAANHDSPPRRVCLVGHRNSRQPAHVMSGRGSGLC